ncbi:MAG: xylulokinase [Lachnospiraceae bacterium]
MRYLLGIDLGTSGTKTVLFDEAGIAISSKTVEYPIHQEQNGWAEQDPMDWWNATVTTIKGVIEESKVSPSDIKGIGISGQMHGLVLVDKEGNVLRKSIIWCDGRTAKQCEEITNTIGKERLIEITANPALTGFTAGKILWVRENEPEIYEKAHKVLLPKDYVRYMLTGVYGADVSDASGMNLMDIHTRDWSKEILEKLELDESLFPKIYESVDVVATVSKEAANLTGLTCDTVVVGGAGDNAAAAVGTGVVSKGNAFTTLGTSGVVFAHSDEVTIDLAGRVHTFAAAVPGGYTVMSCSLAAGLSLKWLKENFCNDVIEIAKEKEEDVYSLMTKMAEEVPIGADRLLFLPYLMGERSPILDHNARGAFIGLSAIHTKANLIRAVLEGVVYSQKHNLDILSDMGVLPDDMTACGGGGSSKMWRQMLADVYDCPVNTVTNKEGPALGAAILAGVGANIYESVEDGCKKVIRYNEAEKPQQENTTKYHQFFEIYKECYPALKEQFHKLANL